MGSKGQLVVRYAGDTRDLEKASVRGVKSIKTFGSKAEAAAVAAGKGAGKGFGDGFGNGAKKAGKDGAESFGSSLKLGVAGAAAAAGVGAAVALTDAMAKEKLGDKVAASLNLTAPQAKKAGKVASELYAGAWGESMPEVSDAVESVMSSVEDMSKASPRELKKVTAGVMDIATAFESDAQTQARNLGILIKTGLADDATEGLDLITAALQKVPKAMRGDASDAIEEYSQFFADLGFDGSQSMALLVRATEGGKYGIDKMGDAIKEFTIRSTDGSKLTKDAFKSIGLDADDMANKFLAGGDTAKEAFDTTIGGLLGIKDPAARAQASIALFGTPLEDLGTKKIPKFLESLLSTEDGLGKTKDAAKKMGDTLNDNVSTKFESAKRQAQLFLTDGLMALWDGFDTGTAKGDGFAGALSETGAALKPIADSVKKITEIPGFPKLAGKLTAIGVAIAGLAIAYKFTGIQWLITTGFPGLQTKAAAALGPIGLVLAGIIALDEWQASKDPDYKSVMDLFIDFPKDPWASIKTSLKQNAPRILDFIPGMQAVKPYLGEIAGAFTWFGGRIGDTAQGTQKTAGIAFNDLKLSTGRKFLQIRTGAGRIWGDMKSDISRNARGMSDSARSSFSRLKERALSSWSSLGTSLGKTGFWIRKRVFNPIGDALETMKGAFRSAKDGIGTIWDGLKKKAAVPVNFVIRDVYNNGIRRAINALPGTQGLREIPTVKYARGGGVFGGIPGKDSVNSLLMPGEHVLTAKEVQKLGGQGAVYKMRKAIQSGEFAGAGDLPAFAKGGGFTGERIAQTQAFAKRQAGKPYGWGAVGPNAYDCSGFMSALTNVLQGKAPHRRRGATADFPWGGFKRGVGQFTVGSSKNFSGGIGHMAGNLAGLGVESRGGRGIILGAGAMSPDRFDGKYHLGASGAAASKSGVFWDAIQTALTMFKKFQGWQDSLSKMGDWSGLVKQVVKGVAGMARGHINGVIPGPGPIPKFDNGGTLSPGYNTVYNGLGRPEPLRRADAGQEVRVVLEIDGRGADDAMIKWLRGAIKVRGGSAEKVLSR